MAQVYEHYLEVEALLAGEMPSHIAHSFEASKHGSRGRQASVLVDDSVGSGSSPKRRGNSRDSKSGKRKDNERAQVDLDEEAGEQTGLLSASEKEEKRERIARIALNGMCLQAGS